MVSVTLQSSMSESESLCVFCTDSAISGDKESDIILIVELPSVHSVDVGEPGEKNDVFIVAKQKILNIFNLGLLAFRPCHHLHPLPSCYTDNNEA